MDPVSAPLIYHALADQLGNPEALTLSELLKRLIPKGRVPDDVRDRLLSNLGALTELGWIAPCEDPGAPKWGRLAQPNPRAIVDLCTAVQQCTAAVRDLIAALRETHPGEPDSPFPAG